MSDLYDFSDVSDLSDSLKGRLTAGGSRTNPLVAVYLDIVVKARSDGGIEVINISQVEAIAERMKLPSKSQQSIRGALNVSVAAGALTKPSRQTYAVADVAGLEPVALAAGEVDPLA